MLISGSLTGALLGYASQLGKPKNQRHPILFTIIGLGIGGIVGRLVDIQAIKALPK